jgi:hypothetical protein
VKNANSTKTKAPRKNNFTLTARAMWRRYYAAFADMPTPLSAANFLAYGAGTTPTLILIDRAGVVRFYHPGAASEAELSARIQAILRE